MQPIQMQSIQYRHANFPGDGQVTLSHSILPPPEPGDVRVRVRRTALCGSDNRLWRQGASQVPGHEIFGVVEQPGHPNNGRRACVYIPVYCGHCGSCVVGHTQSCETQSSLIGWNRDGGFSEYVQVPEQCLLFVPDHIEDRLAPLLLDTIGTSGHAVRSVQRLLAANPGGVPLRDQTVLIAGAGPVGIGVLIALQDIGVSRVEMVDPVPARMAFARELGAMARDKHAGRVGCIFECSGAHAARDAAIEAVLPGGVIVLIGENSAPWTIQEGPVFRRKDFAMLRSFYFPVGEHEENIALLERRREAYRRIVDLEITLDELPGAYPRFANGEALKPLLAVPENPVPGA